MKVRWLGVSLGTASGIEEVVGGITQFPDFKPNEAVRSIVGDEFCQKLKHAERYKSDTNVTLICNPITGVIEIWIERDFLKRPVKARFHSKEIL